MEENEGSYSLSKSTLKVDGGSVNSQDYIEKQIEDAYKAVAALANRKPLIRRQIVQVPSQPGQVRQIVRRIQTPQPDILERVYVVEPQQNYVDLVVERPSTPPPQLRSRTIYASPKQVLNEQVVKVPSRSLNPSQQLPSTAYGYSIPQPTGNEVQPFEITHPAPLNVGLPMYSGTASYSHPYLIEQPTYARSSSAGNTYYGQGYPNIPQLQSINPVQVQVPGGPPSRPTQAVTIPQPETAEKKKRSFLDRFFRKKPVKVEEKVDQTGLVAYGSGSGSYSVPYDYRYPQPISYAPVTYPNNAYYDPARPQSQITREVTHIPEIIPTSVLSRPESAKPDQVPADLTYPQYYPQYPYGYQPLPYSVDSIPPEGNQFLVPSNSAGNAIYGYGYPNIPQSHSIKQIPVKYDPIPASNSITPAPEPAKFTKSDKKKSGSVAAEPYYYPEYYNIPPPYKNQSSVVPSNSAGNTYYGYGYPSQNIPIGPVPVPVSTSANSAKSGKKNSDPLFYHPLYNYPQNYYIPQDTNQSSVVLSNSAGNTFYGYGYPGQNIPIGPVPVPASAKSTKSDKKKSGSVAAEPYYYQQYFQPQNYYIPPDINQYLVVPSNSGGNADVVGSHNISYEPIQAPISETPKSMGSKIKATSIKAEQNILPVQPDYSGSASYGHPYYHGYSQPGSYYPSSYIPQVQPQAHGSYAPEPVPELQPASHSQSYSGSFDTVTDIDDAAKTLKPEIDEAYEAAMSKRKPVLKRQVIKVPGQPGQVKRVVRRVPTPTPDQIERVFVVKHQRDIINLVIERPATPAPQIKTRTIYAKPRKAIINSQVVRVAPRNQSVEQTVEESAQTPQIPQVTQPTQYETVQPSSKSGDLSQGAYQYYPQYANYSTNVGLPIYGSVVYSKPHSQSYIQQPSGYSQQPQSQVIQPPSMIGENYPASYAYYAYPSVPRVMTVDSRRSILIRPEDEPNNKLSTRTSQINQNYDPYQYYYPQYYGVPASGSIVYQNPYSLPQSASKGIPSIIPSIVSNQPHQPIQPVVPSRSAGNVFYGEGYPSQQPSFQYEPVPQPLFQYEPVPQPSFQYEQPHLPVVPVASKSQDTIKASDHPQYPQYGGYSTGYAPNLVYADPATLPYYYSYPQGDYSTSYPSAYQDIPSISMHQQPIQYPTVAPSNTDGYNYYGYQYPLSQQSFQYEQTPNIPAAVISAASKSHDTIKAADYPYYPQYGGYSTGYPPNLAYPNAYNYSYQQPSASNDYPSVIYKQGYPDAVPADSKSYSKKSSRHSIPINLQQPVPAPVTYVGGAKIIAEYIGLESTLRSTSDILNTPPKQGFDETLAPEIEEAYEAYVAKSNRKPTIRREIIKLQGEPGKIRNVVRRVPTPKADVIERVFVVEPKDEVVNLVIERPDTPQPKLKTRTVYPKPSKPIILNQKVVNVPPRGINPQEIQQIPSEQLQAGYYSYSQPSYDYSYGQYPSKVESNKNSYYGYQVTSYN